MRELVTAAGAAARMAVLPSGADLDAHTHDFPYLSLHVLGSYREAGEDGAVVVDGPSAAFHPAGATHSDHIGDVGLTTVVIEFEPRWLARSLGEARAPSGASVYWRRGPLARRAGELARRVLERGGDADLAEAAAFLGDALRAGDQPAEPAWVGRLHALARSEARSPTRIAAKALRLSPPWVARAYRAARGEGLAETVRRARVERAVQLLEAGETSLAQVAAQAGFCDQSHMNRVFRAVLRRTPAQVASERRGQAVQIRSVA